MPPQTAKAFVPRATDRFRPPYGSRIIEQLRQSVFAGSVNHSDYLRDETGARRFWPVACAAIDFDALGRDREQIWAETRQRYLTPTTDTPCGVSVVGVDKRAGDPDRKLDQIHENRVTRCLRTVGPAPETYWPVIASPSRVTLFSAGIVVTVVTPSACSGFTAACHA